MRVAGHGVYRPGHSLEGGGSMPLRIADLTWTLTAKDSGGPGLGLPIALAVLRISLAALLGVLIAAWGRNERMQELS